MNYSTIAWNQDEGQLLDIGELYETLGQVKDKRQDKGKRYTVEILLMVVPLAKLCGENTPYGTAQWSRLRAS